MSMEPVSPTSLSFEDERPIFKYWLSTHQEPTPNSLPNLERDRDEVRRLAQCIRTLEDRPPTLDHQHDLAVVKKYHEWSSWRLFPFNSLPNDIILHIFHMGTFCSPENIESPRMPLLYSKVCRKWRTLSHCASWLWSFLAFNEESPYNLTRHFIELSRTSPLIIEIDISDTRFDFEDDQLWPRDNHLDEYMSMVLPHAHRWRSFLCVTDNWEPMAGVMRHLEITQFPLLKYLELYQNFPLAERLETHSLMSMFASAPPSLSHLRLTGVTVDWQHLVGLHLNLTELSIQLIPFEEAHSLGIFYDMLNTCRNSLRKLSLFGSGPVWKGDLPHYLPTLSFPNLEHFEFKGSNDADGGINLACLYSLLTIVEFGPNLHTLTLGRFPSERNFDSFIPILSSKFSQVKSLRIGYMLMSADQVARWLYVFSKVTTLSLLGDDFQEAVFRALTTPPREYGISSASVLCPELKRLSPFRPQPSLPFVVLAREQMGVPLTTLVWDINQRKILREMRQSWRLHVRLKTIYEGELIDPENIWVGPDPDDYMDDDEG